MPEETSLTAPEAAFGRQEDAAVESPDDSVADCVTPEEPLVTVDAAVEGPSDNVNPGNVCEQPIAVITSLSLACFASLSCA